MNLDIEKEVMIFKKENKYSMQLSSKKQDGTYDKAYIQVQFNKGVELIDRTLIIVKKAWLSFYNWTYQDKKGTTYIIRISDFEIAHKEDEVKQETDPYKIFGNTITVEQLDESINNDMDLPF